MEITGENKSDKPKYTKIDIPQNDFTETGLQKILESKLPKQLVATLADAAVLTYNSFTASEVSPNPEQAEAVDKAKKLLYEQGITVFAIRKAYYGNGEGPPLLFFGLHKQDPIPMIHPQSGDPLKRVEDVARLRFNESNEQSSL